MQAGLAPYCWQRLITFGFSRIRDNQAFLILFQDTQVDLVALLTKQLSKSNVGDVVPSLALTPRGTGAGYGVGVDLDSLMAGPYNER